MVLYVVIILNIVFSYKQAAIATMYITEQFMQITIRELNQQYYNTFKHIHKIQSSY